MKEIRILIADESDLVRRCVRLILSDQESWKIVGEAATEVDLLAIVTEEALDVVIMDTAKPVLGGLDAAKKVLKIQPAAKIIILSIQEGHPLVWCVLYTGERGYTLKPEFSRDLAATVHSVCPARVF
jgi:two-component system invasion response regulator UvrY